MRPLRLPLRLLARPSLSEGDPLSIQAPLAARLCTQSSNSVLAALVAEKKIYILETEKKEIFVCSSLVVATGGLSIPKIGASDFGYKIANQFNLKVTNLYPALVPLTFKDDILEFCKSLAGVSIEASVKINKTIFNEGLIFTHRGISGPSVLQISSYWKPDRSIEVNLLPQNSMDKTLKERRVKTPKQNISCLLYTSPSPRD